MMYYKQALILQAQQEGASMAGNDSSQCAASIPENVVQDLPRNHLRLHEVRSVKHSIVNIVQVSSAHCITKVIRNPLSPCLVSYVAEFCMKH